MPTEKKATKNKAPAKAKPAKKKPAVPKAKKVVAKKPKVRNRNRNRNRILLRQIYNQRDALEFIQVHSASHVELPGSPPGLDRQTAHANPTA